MDTSIAIIALDERKKSLETELETVNTAIEALQKLCTHVWISDGHDSHHRYEKCKLCGETQSD